MKIHQTDTDSTHQTIPEFFEILADMGFREVLKLAIEDTPDHFHVFWKAGLLVALDTYMGSVNSGNCYFNYRGPVVAISGRSGSHALIQNTDQCVWRGDIDIRRALRHNLDAMARDGEFLEEWIEQPFLWLLHYMDTRVEGYDHNEITAERIAMLPEDVRTGMNAH